MTPLKTIAKAVAEYFIIPEKALFQATAVPKHYYPRRVFVYIACVEYGHSTKTLAEAFQCNVKTIQNKRSKMSHDLRQKPSIENQIESIKELVNETQLC